MKINKIKLKYNILIFLVLIICIFGIFSFSTSLGYYSSQAESSTNFDIAFSLLNVEELEKSISLENIEPDSIDKNISFSVSNYYEDKLIDVNMEYYVRIITTTNLQIDYRLVDSNNNDIAYDKKIITDENGTIFNEITTENENVDYNNKYLKGYKLLYNLNKEYDDYKYQDIIEMISIQIIAKQK